MSRDVLMTRSRRSWCWSSSSRKVEKIDWICVAESVVEAMADCAGESEMRSSLPSQERLVPAMRWLQRN